MFSENAKKQIEACRFCWMCRHVCPVGLATGKEADTPRGRAVLLNYMLKGFPIEREVMPDMFACALCGNCSSWCETGFEPTVFIREARREAVIDETVPENVKPIVERVLEKGSIYSEEKQLFPGFKPHADVLLVTGEVARIKHPEIAKALISIMQKAGVDFTVLENEPPTGSTMYDLVGPLDEVKSVAQHFSETVKTTGASTLVVTDPADASFLKQDCATWGIVPAERIVSATSFVNGLLKEGYLKAVQSLSKIVTFHDPCRLARNLDETEDARDILKAIGSDLHEMYLNRENTRCCGGELLNSYLKQTAGLISRTRLDDAKRTGAEICVTACPGCADMLSNEGGEFIKDIFVLVDECC